MHPGNGFTTSWMAQYLRLTKQHGCQTAGNQHVHTLQGTALGPSLVHADWHCQLLCMSRVWKITVNVHDWFDPCQWLSALLMYAHVIAHWSKRLRHVLLDHSPNVSKNSGQAHHILQDHCLPPCQHADFFSVTGLKETCTLCTHLRRQDNAQCKFAKQMQQIHTNTYQYPTNWKLKIYVPICPILSYIVW